MSISNSAVLVELNISIWTANKLDRGATDAVLLSNSASKDSAQVRKNLMAGTDKRKKIADYASRARLYHNQTTLAWADKGARLLPTSLFMDYKTNMNVWQGNINNMIGNFLNEYDFLVDQAKAHMGTLFNADDYPTKEELRDKFGFKLVFTPIPESGDFRLDIPKQDIAELSSQYDEAFNSRLGDAMSEAWGKLHTMLTYMSDKLTTETDDDKKRYHDSLITNAQELCGLLTHLNITKDPKLEEARRSLELTMMGLDIEDIKEQVSVRNDVKARVDDILKKFDW
jgi:hypothetical protein